MNGSASGRATLNSKKTTAKSRRQEPLTPKQHHPAGRLPPVRGRAVHERAAQEYFRGKLLTWKEESLAGNRGRRSRICQEDNGYHADFADRATSETEGPGAQGPRPAAEADRQDRRAQAAREDGNYGFCEETGKSRSQSAASTRGPIATLSIEAQERHERREKVPGKTGSVIVALCPTSGRRIPNPNRRKFLRDGSRGPSGQARGQASLRMTPFIPPRPACRCLPPRWLCSPRRLCRRCSGDTGEIAPSAPIEIAEVDVELT